MNQGTILGSHIGRWILLAALAVALGALLLTIRPVGAQDAPPSLSNAETQFDHAENSTGPITTYRARDPEGNKIFWTLGGTDAADFTIAGGTLRFNSEKFPNGPNYEVPTDRHDDTNNDGTVDAGEDPAGNNTYKVTVRFGAGGEDGDPDPTDDYDGDDLGDIDLTINVTNVNEPGRVVISPRQPQVGTLLTAILTDEDNIAPGVGEWQWARSNSENGPWEDIPALSDEMTYRPTIDDLNMYLQVTVVYVDRAGADSRTVHAVSEFDVRKDIVTSNQRPKFPDQKTLTGGNAIVRTGTDRFISETAAAGTNVGAPVTAFDDRTDIEVITYSLRDDEDPLADSDTNPDTPSESDGHADSFNIDEVTGQITVSDSAMLNADGTPSANDPNPYEVVVRAVDGDGDTQDIDVTIGVLRAAEPPVIDRVYVTGRLGATGYSAGDRAPTEMSHYELDRTNAPATAIDTNLDTDAGTTVEPATYFATDPDAEATTISWSLAGPDAGAFIFEPDARPTTTGEQLQKDLDALRKATGASVTLAFRAGPDFEKRGDANRDNVYEVTIVASDSTELMDKLPVTVKVLNSTDDNKPGKVEFSNRQPEVATALTATFEDPDAPVTQLQWQWYRAQATSTGECAGRTPTGTEHRGFIQDTTVATVGGEEVEQMTIGGATWTKIAGATSATYTPMANAEAELTDVGRCLRATVTYKDSVDRTHSEADDATTDVDETLEGTFAGAEQPVKIIDERNQAPVFKESDYGSARVSVYRAEVAENSAATEITEVNAAVDVYMFDDGDAGTTDDSVEDDTANDLLTYSLSGRDAGSFSIVGTVDNPTPADAADDGTLTFKGGANFEVKREYRVRVTATDPSGDSGFVDVIVDITNINERPAFTDGKARVVYMENVTDPVDTYRAADPEGSGITYSLQTEAVTAVPDDGTGAIAEVLAAAFADEARFEIGSISGTLSFKASPNYEEARDTGTDNMYQVTVRAEVADDSDHFATREVTVIVTDVNEPPVFTRTRDILEITENPDDPNKEPPLAAGYLYLLNRGVGKPTAALPAEPNLDVGIPMVAMDDDNNGPDITPPITGISTDRQLVDGLTYELGGADAGYFHIVPATGQILTQKKLDYESKKEFKVTVKATDPEGLNDTIGLTINLIDVDEVPVPKILRISGDASHNKAENYADALGKYTVAAGGGATVGNWSLEGADKDHFMLEMVEGSDMSRMLKFETPPDYENPRGEAMSETNTNTYMVTIKVTDPTDSTVMDTFPVTVTILNSAELGTLGGPESVSVDEGHTDAFGSYAVTGGPTDGTYQLSLEGDDADQFELVAGAGPMFKFKAAPDYENPTDANADNEYMVTLKAESRGEESMVAVEVTVDDVNELGDLSGPDSKDYAENGTDAVGTYELAEGGTMNATATWMLEGDDASHFMLDGTGMSRMLKFASAPDYETPMGGADDSSNTYMVTVKAMAGGEMAPVAVTVNVTNVDEDGMVSLDPTRPSVGTAITATLEDPDIVSSVTWQWSSADAMDGTFTDISGATSATYTPVDADANMYLMATASYTDGEGSGKSAMAVTEAAVTQVAITAGPTAVDYAENDTTPVASYTAMSANDITWSLTGTDAGDFNISSGGMLSFRSSPNYEVKSEYMVTVVATAGDAMDSRAVTVTVTNVDEAGMVTLSPTHLVAGTEVRAMVSDPDMSVTNTTWQWASAATMDGTFSDIDGATTAMYTVADGDAGMYLRAMASYDDGEGTGKSATSAAVMISEDLVGTYDTNGVAGIQISELFAAIDDYFAREISITELFEVIDAYFASIG